MEAFLPLCLQEILQKMAKTVDGLTRIEQQVKEFSIPWVTRAAGTYDPYKVLISCLLSTRTKDSTTEVASNRLFGVAANPRQMLDLRTHQIEKLIYPVGFYKNKARAIRDISSDIITKYKGKVPPCLDAILSFKGIGRKCANLVLGLAFNIPAICVDTHVHRISNRIGWVRTHEVSETEEALGGIIPKKHWIKLNTLLVAFGQNQCLPISPFCSTCFIRKNCKRIGVKHSR